MAYKNPIELMNHLNIPTKPVTPNMLDDEVKKMFGSRKEGLDYINENYPEGHKDRQAVMERLNRVYPRVPKGSSISYRDRINKQYEDSLPLLREKGYDVDNWDSKKIENDLREFFRASDSDEELQDFYKKGKHDEGNKIWDERYKPTFDALMTALDKYYNDDWWTKAPMGYEED